MMKALGMTVALGFTTGAAMAGVNAGGMLIVHPKPCPGTPVQNESWGRIKHDYR